MKIKPLSLLMLIIPILCQCNFTYQDSISQSAPTSLDPSDFEDGKCYAKCLMPPQIDTIYSEPYPIYTGDENTEDVYVETRTVEIKPASTQWIKKRADKNCVSANPDDCLVWCLVEVPAVTEEIRILVDTTQSKNFELVEIGKELITQDEYTEWREVLCNAEVTSTLVHKIQNTLTSYGYDAGEGAIIDAKTKAGITQFQKDNKLPVGHLDMETLAALGINVY
ncbi:MAG: peptidoglycan-binding domain-containing protein [Bacteroidota bacterium]